MTFFEKSATSPTGRDRLRREAALLARAQHPGVVTLVRLDEQPDRTLLVMARPTDRTLAADPPGTPEDALRVLAAIAATIADLHAIGLAHRRLQPDHVLLADDRPLVCGFADATGTATAEDRALDEAALRELVALLAAHTGSGAGRRSRAGRALRALATAGLAGPLSAAEQARRAGKAIGRPRPSTPVAHRGRAEDAHAAGALVAEPEPVSGDRSRRLVRAVRRAAPLLTVPAVVALVVGWPSGASDHPGSAAPLTPTTAARAAASATDREHGPTTVEHGPTTFMAPATGGIAGSAVRVDAGGATYEVGVRGDQVVVADWACTGAPTAVLLRPSTGEVFFFDALPDTALAVTGRRVATVPDAREVVTDDVGASCPPLAVRDTAGTTHRIGAP